MFRFDFPRTLRRAAPLLAAASLTSPGCAKRPANTRPQVGVTLLTQAHVFYQDLQKGMEAAADSFGMDLHIVAGEGDLARQTSQVENFITQKMAAIIISPVDSRGIVSAVEEANRAGIPVFTADISAAGGHVTSHIASDNAQAGRLLGEYMAAQLKGKGDIAILDQPTVSSVIERVRGFREAIAKYPGIHVIAAPAVDRGLRDLSKNKTDNLLQAYPNLVGIFGSNDDCALGALASVRASGRTNVIIVGFDATPEARAAIASGGPLKADAVQYPVVIGRKTIETIYRALHGEQVPPAVVVPVGIVNQDSLTKSVPAH